MTNVARRDGTAEHDASMEAMARHLYGDGDMDNERERIALTVATLEAEVERMRIGLDFAGRILAAQSRPTQAGAAHERYVPQVVGGRLSSGPVSWLPAALGQAIRAALEADVAASRRTHAMELLAAHGETQVALEEVARLKQKIADDILVREAAEDLTSAYLCGSASGAERMRERAAQIAMAAHEMWWRRSVPTAFHACDEVAKAIRALPLRETPSPDSTGEG